MEVTNTLVALIVLAALVVSIAGTMTTLNVLDQYVSPDAQVTGYISGIVNVSVNESIVISWVWQQINFSLNTPSSGLIYTDNTTDWSPNPFVIRNDGAVNANVTLYASDDLFDTEYLPNSNFRYMCGDNTSSCSGSKGEPNSTVSWTNMPVDAANETLVVYNLSALDASGDEIEIEINVTVPSGESTGEKTSTIVFTGKQACPGDDYCSW